ncbi:hypothetical protein [Kineosporia babensis]|uniref:Uncharacterized protein n=1 Tax=Kineosporia babensis TaxID=499548 RepID=A0A9X1T2B7_9ACTN|nr:hypothetical protein [Kineosporia babensis]MCD5314473.1 hypothetical protein [Kineosporia babensis]
MSELILRGLVAGSRAGLAIGTVSLIASACGFWEACAQKRTTEARRAQIERDSANWAQASHIH